MANAYQALLNHLKVIRNLESSAGLLVWDQQTNMPSAAAEERGEQLATLSHLSHEMFTSSKTLELLDAAQPEIDALPSDSMEARILQVLRYDYQEATKIPSEFVAEMARVTTLAHEVWAKAREANDFGRFAPILQQIVDLTRRQAELLGYKDHPYDALVNMYERGMTTKMLREIFDAHRQPLITLIESIQASQKEVDDSCIHQYFDPAKQKQFAQEMVSAIGFDFNRGRQDIAVHPFQISITRNDIRLTTRFEDHFLNPALFGLMHEAGHGMYEQGVATELMYTGLDSGTSLGVHESQSRMWENIVGRSKEFWQWAYPKLQATFPEQLGKTALDEFYAAINKVEPSFIRVEADEATYNLHILLRFELEVALIEGSLKVEDLPQAWNERFEASFGLLPPTDREGVLQDVHWSGGSIGYFPTYALGNLLSAQYFKRALEEHPQIKQEMTQGNFETLLGWLRHNIHQHGRQYTSEELTQRVTGESIQSRDYLEYLHQKFAGLYNLET